MRIFLHTAGALKCSACRFAVYCSAGCQKSHWKNGHKDECCAHAKQNIHAASFRGDERMIRDLQAEFPALSMDWVHPVDGGTAALVATQEGHVRCLKLLSERGADLTKRTNIGYAPVHSACRFGHTDCLSFLLSAGIRPETPTSEDET